MWDTEARDLKKDMQELDLLDTHPIQFLKLLQIGNSSYVYEKCSLPYTDAFL